MNSASLLRLLPCSIFIQITLDIKLNLSPLRRRLPCGRLRLLPAGSLNSYEVSLSQSSGIGAIVGLTAVWMEFRIFDPHRMLNQSLQLRSQSLLGASGMSSSSQACGRLTKAVRPRSWTTGYFLSLEPFWGQYLSIHSLFLSFNIYEASIKNTILRLARGVLVAFRPHTLVVI